MSRYSGWSGSPELKKLLNESLKEKASKYHSKKVQVDGIWFHSKREAARYSELKLMEKAKKITELAVQYHFPIHVKGDFICEYIADFVYYERGFRVVEDVKGVRTAVYKLKKKLFEAVYFQKIRET